MSTNAEVKKQVPSEQDNSDQADDEPTELAGKYLIFHLGEEQYGIEILKVREIIEMMDVTPVPRTPDSVRGVINLRGKVIPVIEIRQKFGFETVEDTDDTCIIVVHIKRGDSEDKMGIIVDQVQEVLEIEAEDIQQPPDFGNSIKSDFIRGIAKSESNVQILLDIEHVLTEDAAAVEPEVCSSR